MNKLNILLVALIATVFVLSVGATVESGKNIASACFGGGEEVCHIMPKQTGGSGGPEANNVFFCDASVEGCMSCCSQCAWMKTVGPDTCGCNNIENYLEC